MAQWTLSDIRQKIRQVTGRLSPNEMTDDELNDRINKFYQYTFPAEVKLDRNRTYYEFLTTPNQAYYTPSSSYTNFEPPATVDMMDLSWYQEPSVFFQNNPLSVRSSYPWTGDGVTVNFTTTISGVSIYPGTLVVTDNTEVFEDTNKIWGTADIAMTGSGGGASTVNYSTGVITIGFAVAPTSGQDILLSYTPFTPGSPQAILYYNNEFQLYPVPDTAYKIRVKAYQIPDELTLSTDRPLLDQWGLCVAYGTARDLLVDYGEMDSYADVTVLYKEQVSYVINRTSQNLLNTRAMPSF